MRLVRFLFLYILASAFGIALFLLLVQNVQKTRLVFYGREYSISLAWILIGAAVFGGLIMLIPLFPGRLAAHLKKRGPGPRSRPGAQGPGRPRGTPGR